MSKTLLIIICNFLLLSLLPLVELDRLEESAGPVEVATRPGLSEESELIELLELSLQFEQASREQLTQSLEQLQGSLQTAQNERTALEQNFVADKNRLLQELNEIQNDLLESERDRSSLEASVAMSRQELDYSQKRLEVLNELLTQRDQALGQAQQQQLELQRQGEIARQRNEQLEATLQKTDLQKRLLEERLRERESSLTQYTEKVRGLEQQYQSAMQRSATLSADLKAAVDERRRIEETLALAKSEVGVKRVDKEIIETIANTANSLRKEMTKSKQPVSANSLYQQFQDNWVSIEFTTNPQGPDSWKRESPQPSILLTDGQQTYALLHIDNTPLRLTGFKAGWPEALFVVLKTRQKSIFIPKLHFLAAEPRVLVIPVPAGYAEAAGVTPFNLTDDPFNYAKAIMIANNRAGQYGETKLTIDPRSEQYLKILREPFSSLFDNSIPASSDLLFSRTGTFIGLMVNRQYCHLMEDFAVMGTLDLGASYNSLTSQRLSQQIMRQLKQLPNDLQ